MCVVCFRCFSLLWGCRVADCCLLHIVVASCQDNHGRLHGAGESNDDDCIIICWEGMFPDIYCHWMDEDLVF